jgi:hypothetical protein
VIQPPPPDSLEQGRVLKDVTEYAQDYSKHLPNFICTQVTRRHVDPQGQGFFRLLDTVTAKLTYFEQREEKKVVLVNNTPTQTDYEKLGGATSTGEFGSMMHEIFMPDSQARFEWERWATLRGKRMYVFSYHVPQERSKWRVTYENSQSIVPAYRGLIYIDKETLAVMRITLQGENIDPSFPVQAASTVLDYDYQKISGQDYILPLKATLEMRSGRTVLKNEEEFRMYKKFGAEATITFTPDPLPESETKEQKEKQ